MKETIIKCKCDYCNSEMREYEYDNAVKIFIRVQVPNPSGKAGETNGTCMAICNNCSEKLGIIPKEIHNGRMGTRDRIEKAIEKCRSKIVGMFFIKD